jgi:transposase
MGVYVSKRRKRREFSPEFKAEAVKLVLVGGRSVRSAAIDLGISGMTLHRWVEAAEDAKTRAEAPVQAEAPTSAALTATERAELLRLRREVEQLRMDREILKKAAAFFAKESE